jgi:hypothetical protein
MSRSRSRATSARRRQNTAFALKVAYLALAVIERLACLVQRFW